VFQVITDQVGGEDDRTIQRHVADMQQELRKRGEPSREVLVDKMKRTCAYRRQYCQENKTEAVMREFPALGIRYLVSS
jgi:hypothetical protein